MTTADSGSVSPMFSAETSSWIVSGISFGSASTLTSRIVWSRMPPSLTPGASSAPISSIETTASIGLVEVHAQEVDVRRLTAHRVVLRVLEHRRGALPVELELDDRAGRLQGVTQLARIDRERQRIAAASVQDAGHEALSPQTTGRPRAFDGAG